MSLLQTTDVTKRFGSLVAVDSVNLELREDEVTSLIGPNGAGKTTFYSLLAGDLHPDEGTIEFQGTDITNHAPHKIAREGIVRAYQIRNFFPKLTAFENVQASLLAREDEVMTMHRSTSSYEELNDEAMEWLERGGLAHMADLESDTLNYGDQKRLEVLMTMAMKPELAILDEPTAGMSPEETEELVEFLRGFVGETNIFLTEHDMNVVRSISDRIFVLHNGALIAEGTPEEIREDERVRRVYLGGGA